jgi:hypothetical protein
MCLAVEQSVAIQMFKTIAGCIHTILKIIDGNLLGIKETAVELIHHMYLYTTTI